MQLPANTRTAPQVVGPVHEYAVHARLHHPEGVLPYDAQVKAGVHADNGDAGSARAMHPAARVVAGELEGGGGALVEQQRGASNARDTHPRLPVQTHAVMQRLSRQPHGAPLNVNMHGVAQCNGA